MNEAVSGHGVFIYNAKATIDRYGSAALVAKALKECGMRHAWVRIHGATETHVSVPTLPLIKTLQDEGISVAGWGWCQGNNIGLEVELALTALVKFQLDDYVADIEDGVHGANWTKAEIRKFFTSLRASLPSVSRVGLSTFGFIPWHKPELMKAANEFVDFFAPQVYWFFFPNTKMLKELKTTPSNFPLDDSSSYTKLCIKAWQETVSKPLVVTGQAYWGEAQSYTDSVAEMKLSEFIQGFDGWEKIKGLNWWHMGGKDQKAMSFGMYQALKAARLNEKFGH